MTPDLNHLIELRNRKLSPDDLFDIEEHRKGVELRGLVNTEAWQVVKATLKQYADTATNDLLGMAPGDPAVLTAHAAASALVSVSRKFVEDIETAVAKSYDVPAALQPMLP